MSELVGGCNISFIGMTFVLLQSGIAKASYINSNKKYDNLRYVLLIMLKLIITCIKIRKYKFLL